MYTRLAVALAAATLVGLGLAGCATPAATSVTTPNAAATTPAAADSNGDRYPTRPSPSGASSADSASLATATTSLGTVVVDGRGMTVYVFDKDTAGTATSACTGGCATKWPAVTTTSATPQVTGVTGTVATITGADGSKQVTLNGLPLYFYAGDSAAGDVNGQGVGGIWWVVAPDGSKIGG